MIDLLQFYSASLVGIPLAEIDIFVVIDAQVMAVFKIGYS